MGGTGATDLRHQRHWLIRQHVVRSTPFGSNSLHWHIRINSSSHGGIFWIRHTCATGTGMIRGVASPKCGRLPRCHRKSTPSGVFSRLHTTCRGTHQAPSWKPELALYRSEPCEFRMVYVSNQGRLCRNVILNVATTYWGGSSSTFLEA